MQESMREPSIKPPLFPLTGMRFFLAMWVVVFHQASSGGYLGQWMARVPEVLFCLLRTGYMAVGVFFVLSGFILSYNYSLVARWSSSQMIHFGASRFARIYPAYLVGLLLTSPFVVYPIVKSFSAVRLREESLIAAANLALAQAWIPQIATSWNSPGWSLSAEAFFYCTFPFLGVFLWRLSKVGSLLVAGAILWLTALAAPMVAVSLPLNGFGDQPATSLLLNADPFWSSLITLNPLLRLPEFCAGIVLGRAYCRLRDLNSRWLGRGYWLYGPGIFLEMVAIAYGSSLPLPLVSNGLLLPLHSLVILGFALGGGVVARFLSIPLVIFLGNASYAMYILHLPISKWMDVAAKQQSFRPNGSLAANLLYVVLVVGLSAIVFKVLEEPLNRILKTRLVSLLENRDRIEAPAVVSARS